VAAVQQQHAQLLFAGATAKHYLYNCCSGMGTCSPPLPCCWAKHKAYATSARVANNLRTTSSAGTMQQNVCCSSKTPLVSRDVNGIHGTAPCTSDAPCTSATTALTPHHAALKGLQLLDLGLELQDARLAGRVVDPRDGSRS